jgi:ribosomal protein S18 acetylase RimI-like enzyme
MMEGYSMMQLEVRTTNASAIRFYEKQGFRISETLPNFYSNGGSAYRMVCNVMEDAERHTV